MKRNQDQKREFSHLEHLIIYGILKIKPELWNLYNIRKKPNESIRVFPLSNWTEADIWQYILAEDIKIPSLYFSKKDQLLKEKAN